MTPLIWTIVTLLLVGALVFVYVTASVNAEAGRQDDVVSVPAIATNGGEFMRALASVAGHPAQDSNSIELYQNGAEIFPPMLAAIGTALLDVRFRGWSNSGHVRLRLRRRREARSGGTDHSRPTRVEKNSRAVGPTNERRGLRRSLVSSRPMVRLGEIQSAHASPASCG
jgi:hypothetical protein